MRKENQRLKGAEPSVPNDALKDTQYPSPAPVVEKAAAREPLPAPATRKKGCAVPATVVAERYNRSLALDTDGKLWRWGGGHLYPTQSEPDKTFRAVNGAAIDTEGRLWEWVADEWRNMICVQIMPEKRFAAVSAYGDIQYVIDTDGAVWTWGYGAEPVPLMPDKRFQYIRAGHSCTAIDTEGGLWIWEQRERRQAWETYVTGGKFAAEQVAPDTKFRMASFTYASFTAVDIDHRLWVQSAKPQTTQKNSSTLQRTTHPVKFRMCDGAFAIDVDDNLWMWTGQGQTLVQCHPSAKFRTVSAGEGYQLAIDTNDRIWAWGNNANGQFGNGTQKRNPFFPARIKLKYRRPPRPVRGILN